MTGSPAGTLVLTDKPVKGTWLRVRRAGARLTVVGIDAEGEQRQRAQLERRMDRVRKERGGGRFER